MVSCRLIAALMSTLVAMAPGPARAECPQPTATSQALPDAAAARLADAQALAEQGYCAAAGDAITDAYDMLGGQPRRHLDALHALLTDAVHQYVEAHRQNTGKSRPLCAADTLVLRHRARVQAIGRSTPAFEHRLARLRRGLYDRLVAHGGWCPDVIPPRKAVDGPRWPYRLGDLVLPPGRLAAATSEPHTPVAPQRRWQATKRAGVALMAIGLMTLGGGIAAGALERLPRRDLLQASLLVGGTTMFVAGFPLLIIGDQEVRAALAVGPGGARLAF
jgi:hypothetical protein